MRAWPDQRVLEISTVQRHLITTAQLRSLGYTDKQIEYRISRGLFSLKHPRVIALPDASQDWSTELTAAVLWSRGIASHQAAALLHGLPGCAPDQLDVTTHDHRILSRCGIRVHHTNRMPKDQVTVRSRVPCTSAERTLLDLGACISPARVAMAVDHALLNGMVTVGSLDFCLYLTARRGRRGCAVLRDILKRRIGLTEIPNSPLESYLFEFFFRHALPIPQPQVEIFDKMGGFIARPDFVYVNEKVVIEAHSRVWHSDPVRRKEDIARHVRLTREGYRVLYVTWYDLQMLSGATSQKILSLLEGEDGDPLPPSFWGDVRKEW